MSLFNTATHYNVYLDIPNAINFSWNPIYENTVFDVNSYINQLSISDDSSLIVLWGVDRRINTTDVRFLQLNEFYHKIKNPMVLFNGSSYPKNVLDFPVKQIDFFQQLSKQHYQVLDISYDKSKKFLYSSTKDYPERRYILDTLEAESDQGIISYKCIDVALTNKYYSDSDYNNIINQTSRLDSIVPIVGYDNSVEYREIPSAVINNSYLSVVTETFYHGPVFFSEKIFNSMLYGHMFVYLGPVNSLKRLQELGFKTWSHVIDESYDSIVDPYQRLCAVTNSLKEYLKLSLDEIKKIYQDNIDIIEHNKKLVLDTDITDDVVSTMLDAIRLKNDPV